MATLPVEVLTADSTRYTADAANITADEVLLKATDRIYLLTADMVGITADTDTLTGDQLYVAHNVPALRSMLGVGVPRVEQIGLSYVGRD